MELAPIIQALRNRKRLAALVLVIAIAGAAAAKFSSHTKTTGSASLQMVVDSPVSAIADLRQNTAPLATRAAVLAQLMTSTQLQNQIAKIAKIPVSELSSTGPFSSMGQTSQGSTGVGAPASPSAGSTVAPLYQLSFSTQDQQPLITVTAEAPTSGEAERLAAAVFPATSGYLATLQGSGQSQTADPTRVPAQSRVTIRELGPPQVGVVVAGSAMMITVGAFIALLGLGLLTVLKIETRSQRRTASDADQPAPRETIANDAASLEPASAVASIQRDSAGAEALVIHEIRAETAGSTPAAAVASAAGSGAPRRRSPRPSTRTGRSAR